MVKRLERKVIEENSVKVLGLSTSMYVGVKLVLLKHVGILEERITGVDIDGF